MYKGSPLFPIFPDRKEWWPPPSFLCCPRPPSHHPSSLTSISLVPAFHYFRHQLQVLPLIYKWKLGLKQNYLQKCFFLIQFTGYRWGNEQIFKCFYYDYWAAAPAGLSWNSSVFQPANFILGLSCSSSVFQPANFILGLSSSSNVSQPANFILGLSCSSSVFQPANFIKGKGKVFYGQKSPSGESTTTECGVNYQLLAVITEVAQWGTSSCSRPQSATDNGVRDGRSNWLVAPPTHMGSTPWAPRA